jgi:nucleoside-diphosphate-sugar epimerase
MNFINFPAQIKDKIKKSECAFVLTGGSGWVGRAILDGLENIFKDQLSEKVSVYGSSDKTIKLLSGHVIHSQALQNIRKLEGGPKIFLHCAFLTRDRLVNLSPADLIEKNKEISDIISDSVEHSDARGFFSLSSGAVYKKNTRELETDWDINSYGMCKIVDEARFVKLAEEKSIPLVMPRLFNLSGPYINKHETYALASMILSALSKGEIKIHATHQVIRSYVSVEDLLALAFACLLNPHNHDARIFDTAGEEALELNDLADNIKYVLNLPGIETNRGTLTDSAADHYVGSGEELIKMAANHGVKFKNIKLQLEATVDYLQKIYH